MLSDEDFRALHRGYDLSLLNHKNPLSITCMMFSRFMAQGRIEDDAQKTIARKELEKKNDIFGVLGALTLLNKGVTKKRNGKTGKLETIKKKEDLMTFTPPLRAWRIEEVEKMRVNNSSLKEIEEMKSWSWKSVQEFLEKQKYFSLRNNHYNNDGKNANFGKVIGFRKDDVVRYMEDPFNDKSDYLHLSLRPLQKIKNNECILIKCVHPSTWSKLEALWSVQTTDKENKEEEYDQNRDEKKKIHDQFEKAILLSKSMAQVNRSSIFKNTDDVKFGTTAPPVKLEAPAEFKIKVDESKLSEDELMVIRMKELQGQVIHTSPNISSKGLHGAYAPHRKQKHTQHGANTQPHRGYVCNICNREGHWIQQCPNKIGSSGSGGAAGGGGNKNMFKNVNNASIPKRIKIAKGILTSDLRQATKAEIDGGICDLYKLPNQLDSNVLYVRKMSIVDAVGNSVNNAVVIKDSIFDKFGKLKNQR